MNKIEYSNWTFTDADIVSGDVAMSNALMFDSLNPDELTVEVISHALGTRKVMVQRRPQDPATPDLYWYTTRDGRGYVVNEGDIRNFKYGTPLYYYYDDVLQGKYYVRSVERLSEDHFRINAFSAVGMWASIQSYGGVYGQNTNFPDTVGSVLKEIINGGKDYIFGIGESAYSHGVNFYFDGSYWTAVGTSAGAITTLVSSYVYIFNDAHSFPSGMAPNNQYYVLITNNGGKVGVQVEALAEEDGVISSRSLGYTFSGMYVSVPAKMSATSNPVTGIRITLFVSGGVTVSQDKMRVKITKMKEGVRNFQYTVDPDVAAVTLYGWLPVASVRDNVQQILFAVGASLMKDSNGNPRFTFLRNNQPVNIQNERIFIGGQISYRTPSTSVQVIEHSFYPSSLDVRETLFDNTDGQSGTAVDQLILFDKPCYDLIWLDDGIVERPVAGTNYYIANGNGILTGKPYTHSTRPFSVPTGVVGELKESKVEKATLVSLVNSANVAARVADYQATAEEVACGVVMSSDDIECGTLVSFNDPYGEATQGLVSKMNVTMSGSSKADCTIVKGYTPSHFGNNFTSYRLFTSNGTYTATKTGGIRIVLAQGGQGGAGGKMGVKASAEAAGDGGSGGNGGSAGKVHVVDLSVTAGDTFTYTIGDGGSAGTGQTTAEGSASLGGVGGHSTFGSYSSSSGTIPTGGYMNILSGEIYSTNGVAGISGGDGGDWNQRGENITADGTTWTGGAGAPSLGSKSPIGGGGAAYGNNGGDAVPNTSGGTGTTGLGYGGAGANAIPRALPVSLGSGGTGGNGGGGSGRSPLSGTVDWGHSYDAGTGSDGTAGGKGYIIVFE